MSLSPINQRRILLQKRSAMYYAEARRYVQLTKNGYAGRDPRAHLSLAVRYQRLGADASARARNLLLRH